MKDLSTLVLGTAAFLVLTLSVVLTPTDSPIRLWGAVAALGIFAFPFARYLVGQWQARRAAQREVDRNPTGHE